MDGIRICGSVSCYLGDAREAPVGSLSPLWDIPLWTQHNLIVDQGMQALATFLGDNLGSPLVGGMSLAALSDITIGTMQIGDTVSPPAPATGDTSGVGSLVYSPPLTMSYPGGGFFFAATGVVPIGQVAPGHVLTEEALVMRNSLVFAKATFSQTMPTGFALTFVHKVGFARS